jgi:formate hydrogenlyase subunit 3/multisubunit Na+/H+ antiporter MnhD subunit
MMYMDAASIILALVSGLLWIAAAFVSFKASNQEAPNLVAFDGIDLRRTWKWQKALNGTAAISTAAAALCQAVKPGG